MRDGNSLIDSTSRDVNITLPSPVGSYLVFSQNAVVASNARSLQVLLEACLCSGYDIPFIMYNLHKFNSTLIFSLLAGSVCD